MKIEKRATKISVTKNGLQKSDLFLRFLPRCQRLKNSTKAHIISTFRLIWRLESHRKIYKIIFLNSCLIFSAGAPPSPPPPGRSCVWGCKQYAPIKLGGGGTNGKDPSCLIYYFVVYITLSHAEIIITQLIGISWVMYWYLGNLGGFAERSEGRIWKISQVWKLPRNWRLETRRF